jgi:hypothetical protein
MVDYRKFLKSEAKRETFVLPWLGGPSVEAKDRRFRLKARPPKLGWWRFAVSGRDAELEAPLEPAEPAHQGLPKLHGTLHRGWLFGAGPKPEQLLLLPDDEAPLFQRVRARRWHSGDALFEELDFDGEGEEAVRQALDDGATLATAKNVTPALRVAFAWELVRKLGAAEPEPIFIRPTELVTSALAIAEGGDAVARRVVDEIVHARRGGRVAVAGGGRVYVREVIAAARRANRDAHWENVEERAEEALASAGARLLGVRRLGDRIEVRFRYQGDSFTCMADPFTLQILDAGICLVDHATNERGDEQLTLDSLPSVVREAMELGVLVHTRR